MSQIMAMPWFRSRLETSGRWFSPAMLWQVLQVAAHSLPRLGRSPSRTSQAQLGHGRVHLPRLSGPRRREWQASGPKRFVPRHGSNPQSLLPPIVVWLWWTTSRLRPKFLSFSSRSTAIPTTRGHHVLALSAAASRIQHRQHRLFVAAPRSADVSVSVSVSVSLYHTRLLAFQVGVAILDSSGKCFFLRPSDISDAKIPYFFLSNSTLIIFSQTAQQLGLPHRLLPPRIQAQRAGLRMHMPQVRRSPPPPPPPPAIRRYCRRRRTARVRNARRLCLALAPRTLTLFRRRLLLLQRLQHRMGIQ
jgi:hypothetical protein